LKALAVSAPPAPLPGGDDYRDMADRLRVLARLTRSAGIRKELAALAKRYDGVAGHLDDGSLSRASQLSRSSLLPESRT
jgi:hypothetical protein